MKYLSSMQKPTMQLMFHPCLLWKFLEILFILWHLMYHKGQKHCFLSMQSKCQRAKQNWISEHILKQSLVRIALYSYLKILLQVQRLKSRWQGGEGNKQYKVCKLQSGIFPFLILAQCFCIAGGQFFEYAYMGLTIMQWCLSDVANASGVHLTQF